MSTLALISLSVGESCSGVIGGSGCSLGTRAKVSEQPAAAFIHDRVNRIQNAERDGDSG